MEDNRVSLTAVITAYARAYHATHDDPKIFDDFVAPQLFTEQEHRYFSENLAAALAFYDPELAAACPDQATALAYMMRLQSAPVTLSRSRYAEECLEKAVADGVQQYVILGAGLDTFAFRHSEMLQRLHVFEVDHPATQADKKRRLAASGREIPPALHLIPIDFGKQELANTLLQSPYNPRTKSFFSWLGVTYYLSRDQVLATLRAIGDLAPSGSPIVFDYMEEDAFVPERTGKLTRRVQEIVQRIGEPMRTGFEPSDLPAELAGLGLRLVDDLSPSDIQDRYFSDRTDGYHAFEHVHLARAIVE